MSNDEGYRKFIGVVDHGTDVEFYDTLEEAMEDGNETLKDAGDGYDPTVAIYVLKKVGHAEQSEITTVWHNE